MPDLFLTLSWEVRDSSYFILSKKEDTLMIILITTCGFPGVSVGKESSCNSGDLDSILGLECALEESITTHSSTLTWRIPWTEGPGGLQCMGLDSQTRLSNYAQHNSWPNRHHTMLKHAHIQTHAQMHVHAHTLTLCI